MNSSLSIDTSKAGIKFNSSKNISGLSKSEKKNLKRNNKKRTKLQQQYKQRTLPVIEQKNRIIEALEESSVIVIVAETGEFENIKSLEEL